MKNFKTDLESLLRKDSRLVDKHKELNLAMIRELADKTDEKLIELLLSNKESRKKFFLNLKDSLVFKNNDFKFFLDANQLDNSYTSYENKIGLTSNSRLLKDSGEIVLNFPFKDCILEGGQSTEEGTDEYYEYDEESKQYETTESPRKEIFFNEVLAQDEIDRLLEPKAFCKIKKYTKNGEDKSFKKFERKEDGVISENLILKGNNLLALQSLREQFSEKIKLIYIDPPYNIGGDSFKYNDNFNHSTWLTFMQNRLEIARELLNDSGVILVQCDHHEMGYLNVLMDEVFGMENKIQQIAVKVAGASGFKAVNPGPIDVLENILFYAKNKKMVVFKKNYVVTGYHKNYNQYLDNSSKDYNKWKLIPLKEKVIISTGYKNEKEFKKEFGEKYKITLEQMTEEFAFNNSNNVVSIRDLHKPTQQVKALQDKSRIERNKFFVYSKKDGDKTYLINGGALAFYSSKIRNIDGKMQVTELLTNFWNHISWAGIAKEGGVRLKNGKKPEKLIKQILELNTEEGDIVLDYHLGCGTTAAVAHKMKRQYIGIEQLDYGENDGVVRLNNVIQGDQTGISRLVDWQSGGTFIYMELKKWNEEAKELIQDCKSPEELKKLLTLISEKYFLNYNVRFKEFREIIIKEKNFTTLPLKKQKEMLVKMLDLNQLYVNMSELQDKRFNISKVDIALTKNFYNQK